LSSCNRRPGRQGKTCNDRIDDRLHDSTAPSGADLRCSCRAWFARLPFGQGRSLFGRNRHRRV
jgi:hypothetical protein